MQGHQIPPAFPAPTAQIQDLVPFNGGPLRAPAIAGILLDVVTKTSWALQAKLVLGQEQGAGVVSQARSLQPHPSVLRAAILAVPGIDRGRDIRASPPQLTCGIARSAWGHSLPAKQSST